jgi:hypothetical protein
LKSAIRRGGQAARMLNSSNVALVHKKKMHLNTSLKYF